MTDHLFDMGVAMMVGHMATNDAAWPADDPFQCPPDVKESLLRYWHERIPTGGFLRAVLENNLREAFNRADGVNVLHLAGIVRWCWWELPADAWGSPERVRAWLERVEDTA